jgi:hypothetical protein
MEPLGNGRLAATPLRFEPEALLAPAITRSELHRVCRQL